MKDKIVLITGGSRGIGFATAQEFVAAGAKVIILHSDKSVKPNAVFAKEIIADISDEGQVRAAVDSIVSEFGRIDVLVNNAGIAIDKEFEERTVEDWRRTSDVNLIGTWLMSKYVGENMMKNKQGKIINVSSTNGTVDFYPSSMDYDASKAGVNSLTKNLAIQFSPYVNVNAIQPGWVKTEMNNELPADFLASEAERFCLKRLAEPSEIAKVILFLASEAASYINGAIIPVDGGRL